MKCLAFSVLLSLCASAFADQYVRPHVRNDGTFVEGHYRSSPNSTTYDNYSARGNSNPYTGQRGYESPTPPAPVYAPAPAYPNLYEINSRSNRR